MYAALVDSSLTLLNPPYDLRDGKGKFVGWIKQSESTKNCREFHIEADWLLIYRIEGSELCLIRTGTHSDLFE